MSSTVKVIFAERVPLANKGEEAIIRGVQDLLFADRQVDIAVMDMVEKPCVSNGIRVFPLRWLYPEARELGDYYHPSTLRRRIHGHLSRLSQLCGSLGAASFLLKDSDPVKQELLDFFREADYVFLGHDGVWGPPSCPVLLAAKRLGKRAGLFGCGTKEPTGFSAPIAVALYRKALGKADFCFFREKTAYEFMKERVLRDPAAAGLAPDPAFAMRPAADEEALSILESIPQYRTARMDGRPVVVATMCEYSFVFTGSFRKARNVEEKRESHAQFFADVMDAVVDELGALVVFLPHAIDEGRGNDAAVAALIAGKMQRTKENAHVIDLDVGPRVLKAIIKQADYLLGERTHSLIGAVSVCTPFTGFTNSADSRTHDIIGDMCKSEQHLVDMDDPDSAQVGQKVIESIRIRDRHRADLEETSRDIEDMLANAKARIQGAK